MQDQVTVSTKSKIVPWNKGKLIGPKPPLRPKHVWSIRTKLQIEGRIRDLGFRWCVSWHPNLNRENMQTFLHRPYQSGPSLGSFNLKEARRHS